MKIRHFSLFGNPRRLSSSFFTALFACVCVSRDISMEISLEKGGYARISRSSRSVCSIRSYGSVASFWRKMFSGWNVSRNTFPFCPASNRARNTRSATRSSVRKSLQDNIESASMKTMVRIASSLRRFKREGTPMTISAESVMWSSINRARSDLFSSVFLSMRRIRAAGNSFFISLSMRSVPKPICLNPRCPHSKQPGNKGVSYEHAAQENIPDFSGWSIA